MTTDDSFLSRWSHRKTVARTAEKPAAPAQGVLREQPPVTVIPAERPPKTAHEAPGPAADEPAPLTLADVAALGRESDYSAFVGREVTPEVRNAALKKLFTDPHYNVMDGLDTYIDDYGVPDPLPPGMLEQMTQTALLGLFRDEAESAVDAEALAQSEPDSPPEAEPIGAAAPPEPPRPTPDEDPDLRLQPDDADRRGASDAGPDEDPRRQR